jgi:CO/xanthine dehydrogenase Mo-binding subunit
VDLLDQPGQPFLGVAEAAQGPMAAALANALAQATGERRYRLPLLGIPGG